MKSTIIHCKEVDCILPLKELVILIMTPQVTVDGVLIIKLSLELK